MTDTSDIPKIAVIGCGHWGKNHVRNFHGLGALATVADADDALAARVADEYKVPASSLDAILADQTIDGIVIAAPAESHAELATLALEAGKHVFVEKPLALTLNEAEGVLAAAKEAERILMVGHLLQYHPAFIKLNEMVATGVLGKLQYIYSNRLNFGKIRREENALWSFAPHDISMILSLVGEEPDHVTAVGANYLHDVIADVTTTHLAFPGGVKAHVYVSWLHPFKEQKLVIVGDASMAVFNDGEDWDRKLQIYPHRIDWTGGIPTPERADAEPVALEESEPLRDECQHFLDCIITGDQPRTDGAEGFRVLSVLQQAEAAMTASTTTSKQSTDVRFPGAHIHETAVVDDDVEIGAGSKVWHFSHILPETRIGAGVVIGQNASIGPGVAIGDNCKIQNNVSVYKGVTLEQGVFCGPSCVFTNVNTPRAEIERKDEFLETRVGRGATIGANATIVCGHDLGDYCFIAAGATVATNVPAFALMAGVPAKQIGWVSHAGEKLGDNLTCPRDGRRYRLAPGGHLQEIGE